nr:hypothetical protein BSM_28970 [uncultured archaeon]
MMSPNIISLTIPRIFLIHKLTSLSLHSKNIPSVFSYLIFLIKASFLGLLFLSSIGYSPVSI